MNIPSSQTSSICCVPCPHNSQRKTYNSIGTLLVTSFRNSLGTDSFYTINSWNNDNDIMFLWIQAIFFFFDFVCLDDQMVVLPNPDQIGVGCFSFRLFLDIDEEIFKNSQISSLTSYLLVFQSKVSFNTCQPSSNHPAMKEMKKQNLSLEMLYL